MNRQVRLDDAWYQHDAVQAMKGSSLVEIMHNDNDDDNVSLLSCQSAYAEVVALAVILMACTSLPFWYWETQFHRRHLGKRDGDCSCSNSQPFPVLVAEDPNRQDHHSSTVLDWEGRPADESRVSELTPSMQKDLRSSVSPDGPCTGLFMAPEDFMAYLGFYSTMYMVV